MKSLDKIFNPNNILLDIPATSKKRAFEQISLMFENRYNIGRAEVFESLFARERLGSTGLGHGVAIPHGRVAQLEEEPIAAFVRLAEPISFESPDGEKVRILFVLLVPENENETYLDILSCIAKILSDQHIIHHLLEESDSTIIYELITEAATEIIKKEQNQ